MRTAGMVSGWRSSASIAHFAAGKNVGDRVADQFADPFEPVA